MSQNLWQRWLKSLKRPARRRAVALERLEDRTVPALFNAPLVANLPGPAFAEAVGHFRGADAPLDAVTVSRASTLSVLLGNGDGSFQAPTNISLGGTAFTNLLAVGDLGNGHDDIVAANGNGTVDVLLGNGDGTFQSPQVIQVGSAGGVALGDFLGNGRQDIVFARGGGRISVLLNNGDGTFSAPVDTTIPGTQFGGLNALTVGDFDHNGKLGVAVATDRGIDVLSSNGDGTFTIENTINSVATFSVAAADLRHNGTLDLVARTDRAVEVVLGNGDGTFQSPVTLSDSIFSSTQAVAVGDFTGDGKPDIATLNNVHGGAPTSQGPNLTVWVNNGDGTFHKGTPQHIGASYIFLTAGDFHGDGKLDLLAGGATATVFTGKGDGTFNLAPTFAAGTPNAVAAGDFTGSGRAQDLVVAGETGNVVVLLNNGDGTFRNGPTFRTASSSGGNTVAGPVVVGDFLGNGKQDIAVAVSDDGIGGNEVEVFLGNGDGTFQAGPVLTLPGDSFGQAIQGLAVADLNGDGRQDIIVASSQTFGTHTGQLNVFLSNGDGTFAAPETFTVGTAANDVVVADLRGDGKLDLITSAPAAGGQTAVEVLFGNGDGTFQNPVTVFTGAGGKLAVGDFLGNGRQDIVTFTSSGTVNLLENNGDGTFASPITTQTGVGLDQVTVGDFFQKGHFGLAFTTRTIPISAFDSGTPTGVLVLRANNDGTFQSAGGFLTGFDAVSLTVGDFAGHGKIDLATGDRGAVVFGFGTVSVLRNQGSPAAPTVQGFQVNDGSGQDPAARSLTVTFSTQVTLADGALEVQDASGNDVPLSVSTALVNGRTVATVTFTGGNLVGGALPTGSYTLTAHSALIHDALGQPLQQVNGADPSFAFTSTVTTAAATVTSVRLNEGAPAPANVSSITLHFSGLVSLGQGAVEVLQQGGGSVGLSVAVGVDSNGDTVAVLTFTGDNLVDGALPDGSYTLVIHGGQITDGQGQALGGSFAGDNAADFTAADGAGQPDLLGLFHPLA